MNETLYEILEAWRPEHVDVAELRRGVWRRVEAAEALRAAAPPFWRPLTAGALLVAAVLLGLHLGERASHRQLERAYLASVNPYRHFE